MVSVEHKAWLTMFNPCGFEIVMGFPHKACHNNGCEGVHCLSKKAYRMAEFVIDGSNLEQEETEFSHFMSDQMVGQVIIDLSGKRTQVTKSNVDDFTAGVYSRARTILQEVDMCVQTSDCFTEEALRNLSSEQLSMQKNLANLNSSKTRGILFRVEDVENKMKLAVQEALNKDMGNFGLIARLAIVTGLGDRVSQGAMTQIFKR